MGFTLALDTPAGADAQYSGETVYAVEDGPYGVLCAAAGWDSIQNFSDGWSGIAQTHLRIPYPCFVPPGGGCCNAGSIEVWANVQRQDGTMCLGSDAYNANGAGSGSTYVGIGGACGAPASGTKRTKSTHRVDLYNPNQQTGYWSPWHAAH